jgi:hypothetical protein
MASGAKMIILGTLWMANFIILIAMVLTGGVITNICNQLVTMFGAGYLDFGTFSYIFPFIFFLALVTLIAITYKIYQQLASDNTYYPGW